jgi:Protein of unknown function (DUF3551)
MKQLLKMTAAPATALFTLAFVAMATPASAGDYCSTNSSGMRGCGYLSLEQCQAATAGVYSSCYRDPFLADTGSVSGVSAYAYQPKHVRSKKPAGTQ